MLDLDCFKPVNDQYGHHVSDELLVAIGARLTAAVRTHDIVARVGGDEFVIVATEVKTEVQAADVAMYAGKQQGKGVLVRGVA